MQAEKSIIIQIAPPRKRSLQRRLPAVVKIALAVPLVMALLGAEVELRVQPPARPHRHRRRHLRQIGHGSPAGHQRWCEAPIRKDAMGRNAHRVFQLFPRNS